jgi:hypothetical protein
VFHTLLIPEITLPKSTSAKPAGSTANSDVGIKNGAAPRISASMLLRLPCICQGLSRLTAKDKTLRHFGISIVRQVARIRYKRPFGTGMTLQRYATWTRLLQVQVYQDLTVFVRIYQVSRLSPLVCGSNKVIERKVSNVHLTSQKSPWSNFVMLSPIGNSDMTVV